MSTSLLYHAWNLKDYTQRAMEFRDGAVWMHVEKKPEKRVCPECLGTDFVLAGKVAPPPAIRGLPIGKKPVWIVPHLHRVLCVVCECVVQEARLFADPKKHYTHQMAQYALDLCKRTTMSDVASHLGMSWDTIKEIVKNDLQDRSKKVDWRNLRLIAIDEISISKGQKYLTVVLNLETGRVLYVAESRRAEALAPFFKILRRKRTKLEAVAMDMSGSYKFAVETYYNRPCSIVYDRFHVMKLLNEELDDIRREEMRNADSEVLRRMIKGKRYLLLYALENLPGDKHSPLEELLRMNKNLCSAYILKEQLRAFWDAPSREFGEDYLRAWIAEARATGIRQLVKFAKTLEQHWDGLVAYFDHRITTGKLEGVNNSIKTLKRKAYGYRDVEFFKLRILFIHECSVKFAGM